MMVYGSASSQESPAFAAAAPAAVEQVAQQAALRQQESAAHARHGSNSSPKSTPSGSSVGEKTADPTAKTSFFLALPFSHAAAYQGAGARFEEKMQDAEDQDCEMSY
eukprot:scaffold30961_cov101-Skeletonema_dohrnii-CCMP3373.AAC.3